MRHLDLVDSVRDLVDSELRLKAEKKVFRQGMTLYLPAVAVCR
jgi:hypothetical protein